MANLRVLTPNFILYFPLNFNLNPAQPLIRGHLSLRYQMA